METKNRRALLLYGIIISNLAGFLFLLLSKWILDMSTGVEGLFIFSDFVLVPIGMGIICYAFWRKTSTKLSDFWWNLAENTLVAIGCSWFIMQEGVICLIIVSPLIVAFMFAGLMIGKYLIFIDNGTLRASTVLIFFAIFIFDTFSIHDFQNKVTDQLVINAPKEVVWKYVAAHPINHAPADYWLFKVGLPYPVQSTVSEMKIGANRKCIFSNGAVFDETVSEFEKDSIFTFDIIKQPADPEIIGHINIERGKFSLHSNPNGSTTLTGISWYILKVYPAWYYNWWAEDITRNVHLRVMEHIKKLSERDVQL
jgi:hypothetical protein